jgi:hypothetical protein
MRDRFRGSILDADPPDRWVRFARRNTAQVVGSAAARKAEKPNQKISNPGADDEEPVQWWIAGWKER